jgi:hypothetical protein
MALAGHTASHAPQSIQIVRSIKRASSFSEIALTGHWPSHAPQLTHSALSTNLGIYFLPSITHLCY